MYYPARGVMLYYEAYGSGPVVLLLHGFTNFAGGWRLQVEPLVSAGYRVVIPELAGHGRSAPMNTPTTVPELAADIVALLDHLSIPDAAVAGLSLGGMVAQQLAVDQAGRVRQLVLADTAPRFDAPSLIPMVEQWIHTLEQRGAPARLEEAWPLLASPGYRASSAGQAAYKVWAKILSTVSGHSLAAVARGMLRFNLCAELPRIHAPTLVLVGADDHVFPLEHSQWLAQTIPGAQLLVLPHTGHLANLEAPALFNRHLIGFLAQHSPR